MKKRTFPSTSTFYDKAENSCSIKPNDGNNMQNDEDDVWENLNDDEIEECMLKATQVMNETSIQCNNSQANTIIKYSRNNVEQIVKQNFSSNGNAINDFVKSSVNNSVPGNIKNLTNKTFNNITFNSFNKTKTVDANSHKNNKFYEKGVKNKLVSNLSVKENANELDNNCEEITVIRNLRKEIDKLKEEALIKAGEVSNIRNELKRKEHCLEMERLEKISALDSAEKKAQATVFKSVFSLEEQKKDSLKTIERLQGELHFKNREVEELQSRCRKMEQEKDKRPFVTPHDSSAAKRLRSHSPVSNKALHNSRDFASWFDLSSRSAPSKSVSVQTEARNLQNQNTSGHWINVQCRKGKFSCERLSKLSLRIGMLDTACDSNATNVFQTECNPKWLKQAVLMQNSSNCNVQKTNDDFVGALMESFNEVHQQNQFGSSTWNQIDSILNILQCYHTPLDMTTLKSVLDKCYESEEMHYIKIKKLMGVLCNAGQCTCPILSEKMGRLFHCYIEHMTTISDIELLLNCIAHNSQSKEVSQLWCSRRNNDSCLLHKTCRLLHNQSTVSAATLPSICRCLLQCLCHLLHHAPAFFIADTCSCAFNFTATTLKLVVALMPKDLRHHETSESTGLCKILRLTLHVLYKCMVANVEWWVKLATLHYYILIMEAWQHCSTEHEDKLDEHIRELVYDLY